MPPETATRAVGYMYMKEARGKMRSTNYIPNPGLVTFYERHSTLQCIAPLVSQPFVAMMPAKWPTIRSWEIQVDVCQPLHFCIGRRRPSPFVGLWHNASNRPGILILKPLWHEHLAVEPHNLPEHRTLWQGQRILQQLLMSAACQAQWQMLDPKIRWTLQVRCNKLCILNTKYGKLRDPTNKCMLLRFTAKIGCKRSICATHTLPHTSLPEIAPFNLWGMWSSRLILVIFNRIIATTLKNDQLTNLRLLRASQASF